MGKGAGGDEIRAEFGDGANVCEGDATAGLGPCAVADERKRGPHRGGGKIVEENDVNGVCVQDGRDLLKRVHLAFNQESGMRAAGVPDERGKVASALGGVMVVLEHDAVKESEAVIPSSGGGGGVFLQHPPARGGFARVEEGAGQTVELAEIRGGVRGDARELLEIVQECSLSREERGGGRLDGGDGCSGGKLLAIGMVPGDTAGAGGSVGVENEREEEAAAESDLLAGVEVGAGGLGSRAVDGKRVRGGIARGSGRGAQSVPGKIFVTGRGNVLLEVARVEIVPLESLMKPGGLGLGFHCRVKFA